MTQEFSFDRASGASALPQAAHLSPTHPVSAAAAQLLGTPFCASSQHPEIGLDCSGFLHATLKRSGYRSQLPQLPQERPAHDAEAVRALLSSVADPIDMNNAALGDILHFVMGANRMHHLGIIMSDGMFAHAHGRRGVCLEQYDYGWFRRTSQIWRIRQA